MSRILGIDLGNTVVQKNKRPFPHCFHVIREATKKWDDVFIVSRVNEVQKKRAIAWLESQYFHAITGIPLKNINFCFERSEKGPICKQLGITHFIDDRPEVMYHLDKEIIKFLICPDIYEYDIYRDKLKNVTIVQNWTEIEKLLNL